MPRTQWRGESFVPGSDVQPVLPTRFEEVIKAFDSHERGILFQWAAEGPFALSPSRCQALSELVGVRIPARPYLAMDYTLDWLHAAITCYLTPTAWQVPQPIVGKTITGSQEDVDLLVAWEDDRPRLLLVEAKGFTGWSNKQMASKAARLESIITPPVLERIDVHFVLVGPSESKGLLTDTWPAWMRHENRVHFLQVDDPGARRGVRRSAPGHPHETGPVSKPWSHWSTVPRKWQ